MALVSHTNEFVFLKTRKTAGTTVEMFLEPLCRPAGHVPAERTPTLISREGVVARRMTPLLRPGILHWRRNRWRQHMTAAEMRRALGAARWGRYRKISTVRNPFDRAISQFHWAYREYPELKAPFDEKRALFSKFLCHPRFKTDYNIAYLDDEFILDDVVRFEHLREDVAALTRRNDWPLDIDTLPHMKSSRKARGTIPVSDYYRDEDRDQVLKHFSWIFDRCGYSTDPRDADQDTAAPSPSSSSSPRSTENDRPIPQ